MNEKEKTAYYHTQSRKHILVSTMIAAVIATVILFTIILPVEYGIDPTRIGNALGLNAISDANEAGDNKAVTTIKSSATISAVSDNDPFGIEWFKGRDPYAHAEVNPRSKDYTSNSTAHFKNEVIEIPMQADEELEYKFQMQAGQMLLYSWDSGDTEMYFEFHAEPTEGDYPEGYYMSYQIGDGSTAEQGSLVAPFTGNHGWYFLNLTENPATIRLEVSGYYESHGRLHY